MDKTKLSDCVDRQQLLRERENQWNAFFTGIQNPELSTSMITMKENKKQSVSTSKKYLKPEKKLDSVVDIKLRMDELMNKTYSNNLTLKSIVMNEKMVVITYLLWKNGNRWFDQFNSAQLWETLTRNTNRPHIDLLKDYLELHLLLSRVIHAEQSNSIYLDSVVLAVKEFNLNMIEKSHSDKIIRKLEKLSKMQTPDGMTIKDIDLKVNSNLKFLIWKYPHENFDDVKGELLEELSRIIELLGDRKLISCYLKYYLEFSKLIYYKEKSMVHVNLYQ